MTLEDIEQALKTIIESKELRQKANVGKRTMYELRNQGERPFHIRRKLEILYNAGMLKITDATK